MTTEVSSYLDVTSTALDLCVSSRQFSDGQTLTARVLL